MTEVASRLAIGEEVEARPEHFEVGVFSSPALSCVVCGHEWTHVRTAYTSFGTDESEGGRPYDGTVARGVRNRWRRDALVIEISAECGHEFALILQQHKGSTFLRVKRLPDSYPEE